MRFSIFTGLTLVLLNTYSLPASPNYDVCSCDLKFSICDINCCCDEDCSKEDILVFTKCIDAIPQFDPRLCSSPATNHSIILNDLNSVKKSSNIFCISRDNNDKRHYFSDEYLDVTYNEYEHLLSSINYSNLIPIKFSTESESDVFGLPNSIFSNLCESKTSVIFMQDYSTECVRYLPSLPNDCKYNEEVNVKSYTNIDLLATANDISYFICTHDINNCHEGALISPNFNEHVCQNMVEEIHYYIYSTLPDKVDYVAVKFFLREIIYLNESIYFKQKFSVTFQLSEDYEEPELIGNSDYSQNGFILAGWLNEDHIEYITTPWFEIFDVGFEDNCLAAKPLPISFGENVVTSCIISVNEKKIQNRCGLIAQISYLILYKNLPTHIGAYGTSDPNNIDDWVPIQFYNLPDEFVSSDCSNYISTIHINVVYIHEGFESNRQVKIIGAKAEYSSSAEIFTCLKYDAPVDLDIKIPFFISLYFTQVSVEPIPIYAPLPVIDIKLPYDFFYPFIYNHGVKLKNQYFVMFIFGFFVMFIQSFVQSK